mgnify:CR=1 FL=1
MRHSLIIPIIISLITPSYAEETEHPQCATLEVQLKWLELKFHEVPTTTMTDEKSYTIIITMDYDSDEVKTWTLLIWNEYTNEACIKMEGEGATIALPGKPT